MIVRRLSGLLSDCSERDGFVSKKQEQSDDSVCVCVYLRCAILALPSPQALSQGYYFSH